MSDSPKPDPYPSLRVDDWESTRELMHMWTQVVGKIRMAREPMVNHWWQVTSYVSARGLTTGVIHDRGSVFELEFDLVDHELLIRSPEHPTQSIELCTGSVAGFYKDVMAALERLDHAVEVWPVPVEVAVATPFLEDTTEREYSPEHAHLFWRQLVAADRILKQFRSEFAGKVSPVHFFWGSFDMAVTRFSGRGAPTHPGGAPNCADWVMVEGYSHELTSCGFWPGGGEEGAFYAYAYPEPDGYREAAMTYASDEWMARLVLGFGPDVRVLAPDSLVERVRGAATAALAAYAELDG